MYRGALTLLEVAVSLVSSLMLVGGLAGALYISTRALPSNDNVSRQSAEASRALCDFMADVHLALGFSELTPRAVTFTIPDRDGDLLSDTIRYAWSGTPGDPLTYSYNGGAAIDIANSVQSFNIEAITRTILADMGPGSPPGNVAYHGFDEAKGTSGTALIVPKPAGTTPSDLLIAAVALDGNAVSSISAPGGWTLLHKGPSSGTVMQTFAVWWKIAGTEPVNYSFTWSGSRQSYGWIMRFSDHDPTNPINASTGVSGTGLLVVPSPAVNTTVQHAMIVRLVGLDGKIKPTELTSLLGHTFITNDSSNDVSPMATTGAAGFITQATPGGTGTSSFILTGAEEYTSVTIAIAPNLSN